jgi:hypothetical protein
LAELGSRLGAPVWRVNSKVFVQLGGRLRVAGEEEIVRQHGELALLVVDRAERSGDCAQVVTRRPDGSSTENRAPVALGPSMVRALASAARSCSPPPPRPIYFHGKAGGRAKPKPIDLQCINLF